MPRLPHLPLVAWVALAAPLAAQEAGGFTLLHGGDTVAVEQFARADAEVTGQLIRPSTTPAAVRERIHYRAVTVADESAPLIELSSWRASDAEASPPRQRARVIFKDDSASVDDATSNGLTTRVLPTRRAAIPYLNLSMALLELATRRAREAPADSISVPFFNLGGGQTALGTLLRVGDDSLVVRLGQAEFRLRVDGTGRILGGAVPAQGLTIQREGAR
jgi:hypothetical protein